MDLHDAVHLARALMDAHGLADWEFGLDRARRRAGVCRHEIRTIALSAPLTRGYDDDLVRDTILHEIAHALVGPQHGHDDIWQATAIRIGCSGLRCLPDDAPRIEGRWVGTCPAGHQTSRHKRPLEAESCATCEKKFNPRHLVTWTVHDVERRHHSSYVASLVRLAERHGPVPTLIDQLETDRLLGGGPDCPHVRARLRPLRPGDQVIAQLEGTDRPGRLLRFRRTRWEVEIGGERYRCAPSLLRLSSDVEVSDPAPPHHSEPGPASMASASDPASLGGDSREERAGMGTPLAHLSLVTWDGRFAMREDTDDETTWITPDRDVLLSGLTDSRAYQFKSATESLELPAVFADARQGILHVALATDNRKTLSTARISDCMEPAQRWEDWHRVEPWIASLAIAAHRDDQDVVLDGEAERVRICFRPDAASGPSVFVSASFQTEHEVWQSATVQDHDYVLQAPLTDEMIGGAARLALIALRGAGLGPLDVFPARQNRPRKATGDIVLEFDANNGESQDEEIRLGGSRRLIVGVHIPADPRKAPKKVVLDGSDAINFYPHVSDGPVEYVQIPIPQHQDHALYVNSRYMQLPASMVNPRASLLLDNCSIGMAGGAIRGDALLIGVLDESGYPTSADPALVAALT